MRVLSSCSPPSAALRTSSSSPASAARAARAAMTARFSRAEVEPRRHQTDAVIIIDNVVYDVTAFLEEHPGGHEVLLRLAGGDASRCFREVGHSEIAHRWREQFKIGELIDEDKWEIPQPTVPTPPVETEPEESLLSGLLNVWGPPVILAILAALLYSYLFQF